MLSNPLGTNYIRGYLLNKIGQHNLIYLHQTNAWVDWLVFLTLFFTFFLLIFIIAQQPLSPLLFFCFLLQAIVIQMLGLFSHDACTHRKFAGKFTYLIDLLCCSPGLRSPSAYYVFHMKHHKYLNSEHDPEVQIIKNLGVDSIFKRFLLCSILGVILINFNSTRQKVNNTATRKILKTKITFEYYFLICFLIVIVILAIFFPHYVFFGYLLPILTVAPIVNMSRIIIEHTDIDPSNKFQIATFYRTNILTRLIFFYDSGDCHLIHHLYPGIPFYKMSAAIKLITPFLIAEGVQMHTSLWKIYYGFFFQQQPFRGPWKKLPNHL